MSLDRESSNGTHKNAESCEQRSHRLTPIRRSQGSYGRSCGKLKVAYPLYAKKMPIAKWLKEIADQNLLVAQRKEEKPSLVAFSKGDPETPSEVTIRGYKFSPMMQTLAHGLQQQSCSVTRIVICDMDVSSDTPRPRDAVPRLISALWQNKSLEYLDLRPIIDVFDIKSTRLLLDAWCHGDSWRNVPSENPQRQCDCEECPRRCPSQLRLWDDNTLKDAMEATPHDERVNAIRGEQERIAQWREVDENDDAMHNRLSCSCGSKLCEESGRRAHAMYARGAQIECTCMIKTDVYGRGSDTHQCNASPGVPHHCVCAAVVDYDVMDGYFRNSLPHLCLADIHCIPEDSHESTLHGDCNREDRNDEFDSYFGMMRFHVRVFNPMSMVKRAVASYNDDAAVQE